MAPRNARNSDAEPIKVLHTLVAIGLTTPYVVGVVTGIEPNRIQRLLSREIEPTDFEKCVFESLVADYKMVVTIVNTERFKHEILRINV
jgi:hypothetical protein